MVLFLRVVNNEWERERESQETFNLHDFLSAFRVLFLSLGWVLVPAAFVAVFTRLSRISSSPSVNSSREIMEGVRKLSGRRRRKENVPESGLSKLMPLGRDVGVPRICLKEGIIGQKAL